MKKESKNKDDNPSRGSGGVEKEVEESTIVQKSGWLHKGEHK